MRVTAAGLVTPRKVLLATFLAFGAATLTGVYLAFVAGWPILVVGGASILAGVLYTGGPRPYGYEGLGEVFVFLFFGLVAVNGSYFVQVERLDWTPLVLSIPVGMLSTAILVVNNVRDIDTDRRVGKRTLAVRLGRGRARVLYAGLVYGAFVAAPAAWLLADAPLAAALLPLLSQPLAPPLVAAVAGHTDGAALNRALANTGRLLAAFSLLLAAGVLTG